MMNRHEICRQISRVVFATPNCDIDDIAFSCSDLTWNQIFMELDRMSRTGEIMMRQDRPGHYRIAPGATLPV